MKKSKNIPISRCAKCVHFNGHICHFEDLEPCQFEPTIEAENELAKTIFFICVVIVAVATSLLFWWLSKL